MENTTNQQDEKGHDANIVLAVSGLTPNYLREIEERIIWRLQTEFKDKHDLVQQIVSDNFENLHKCLAACASGAVDTVAEARVCNYCNGLGYDPYQNHDTTMRPCPQCGG